MTGQTSAFCKGRMRIVIATFLMCLIGCAHMPPSTAFNPPPGFRGLHIIPRVAGQRISAGRETVSVPTSCTNINLTVWIGNGLPTDVFVSCRFTEVGYASYPQEGYPDGSPVRHGVLVAPAPKGFTLLQAASQPRYTPGCCPQHSGLASAEYNLVAIPKEWAELRDMEFSLELTYYLLGDTTENKTELKYRITVKKDTEQKH